MMIWSYHVNEAPLLRKPGEQHMPKIGQFKNETAKANFLREYDSIAAKWPVPSTQLDIETSFGSTRVRKSGSGNGVPLVLLPGIGGNGQIWHRFIADLTTDRIVYTPDVIGWAGRCEQTSPVQDSGDIAAWMAEVIEGLGEKRVHLAGNSVGSWLAGAVALHRSDKLASLIMLEPSAATFLKPTWGLLLKFMSAGSRPNPERMRKFNKWLMPGLDLTEDELALSLATIGFRAGMPWDRAFTDEQLATIALPTLILFGADTVVQNPNAAAERARTHLPNADIEIIGGVGHDLLWANPGEIIPRLLGFIAEHE